MLEKERGNQWLANAIYSKVKLCLPFFLLSYMKWRFECKQRNWDKCVVRYICKLVCNPMCWKLLVGKDNKEIDEKLLNNQPLKPSWWKPTFNANFEWISVACQKVNVKVWMNNEVFHLEGRGKKKNAWLFLLNQITSNDSKQIQIKL